MANIKCSVDNCSYWDTGNICAADAIKVGKNIYDNNDMEAGTMGTDPSTSDQTKCITFKKANNK